MQIEVSKSYLRNVNRKYIYYKDYIEPGVGEVCVLPVSKLYYKYKYRYKCKYRYKYNDM